MAVKFESYDIPIAYSMIEAANKLDQEQIWYHPYHKYFCYWTAFNNIYATIAFTENDQTSFKFLADGSLKRNLMAI